MRFRCKGTVSFEGKGYSKGDILKTEDPRIIAALSTSGKWQAVATRKRRRK